MPASSKSSWMPVLAGILLIVAGAVALLRGLARMFLAGFVERPVMGLGMEIAGGFQVVMAVIIIIGAIFALQRKVWWLALTASVIAVLQFMAVGIFSTLIGFLGIFALILVAASRQEFV
jgi:hypothetical protein